VASRSGEWAQHFSNSSCLESNPYNVVNLACSACLTKGLYILCQVWDVSEYIFVIVSQIITKFGECVGCSSPVFIAVVFFFDLGCMLINCGRLLILL